MRITFWKGIFVADAQPGDQKDGVVLRKAKFQLHEPSLCDLGIKCKPCRAKIGRRWWSDRVESATRLKQFCNELALRAMSDHLKKLALSRALDSNLAIPVPDGKAYLPYQRGGIAYAVAHQHTLIGDDMGLGKTVETIGFVNYVKPKNVLIVCPKSGVFNWRNEALDWLVDNYEIWPAVSKDDAVPNRDGLFVITNYDKIADTSSSLFQSLARRSWDTAAFDECHYLKNIDAKRSQAIFGEGGLAHISKRCLFLSGTPAENFPREIWTVAAFCAPAKFGDWWEFARRYCGLHQEDHKRVAKDGTEYVKKVWVADGATNLPELQQRLRSTFMVRRLKKDVLKELPPKRRQLVELSAADADWQSHPQFKRWREIYERRWEEHAADVEAATTAAQYHAAAAAMERFTEIAFQEMSEFRHTSALVKLPLAIKYIEEMLASGVHQLVIFGHHTDVLKKLHEHFDQHYGSVLFHGQTSEKKRAEAVALFQAGKKRIFVGQFKAAGTVITLTAASTVVFVELDWVPGVVTQAEDRLCRIGQKKMVHVIHLCMGGTLDANMVKKIIAKQKVLEKMLDEKPDLKRAA